MPTQLCTSRISIPLTQIAGHLLATFAMATRLASICSSLTRAASTAGMVEAVMTRSSMVTSMTPIGSMMTLRTLGSPKRAAVAASLVAAAVRPAHRCRRAGCRRHPCAASTANESSLTCCDAVTVMTAAKVLDEEEAGAPFRAGPLSRSWSCHATARRSSLPSAAAHDDVALALNEDVLEVAAGQNANLATGIGQRLIASLIEVNCPTLSTPSPTVQVQQQRTLVALPVPMAATGVRQSVAELGKVTIESRV